MLVAVAVLSMIIVLVARLYNAASITTSTGTKRMNVNAELRPLFNRLSSDLSKMVLRDDIAAYAKTADTPQSGGANRGQNDILAFYSLVDGFFPTSSTAEKKQPQTSLLSYRINTSYQLERMAKGLAFAGQDTSTPLLFGTANSIALNWPNAISATSPDDDFSVISPSTFRFEYYYILKGSGLPSVAQWPSIGQIKLNEISAIVVAVALTDPKSKTLLSADNLEALSEAMEDYEASMGTAGLTASWQAAIKSTAGIPQTARSSIRVNQWVFRVAR